MSEIKHLLILRIAETLSQQAQDPYASADPAKVVHVQPYRFQGDPIDQKIYAYVTDGDPKDPYTMDGRIDAIDADTLGLRVPAGEIGGGHLWWRRGRVVFGCYYLADNLEQLPSADYAHIVLGRIETAIERTIVTDLVDEFGERAHKIFLTSTAFFEGGGPDDQYLWRGEVLWQVLTQRPV